MAPVPRPPCRVANVVSPPLHPELDPLGFLLGRWRGEGRVRYPTIDTVEYGEEMAFTHVGKPFLAYAQRSWALDDGRPLATSTGYWRFKDGQVELLLAHPTGLTEIALGTAGGRTVRTVSEALPRTPTAKRVDRLERSWDVDGDTLSFAMRMAAVGQPLHDHLDAALTRRS